jgi:hypothetical protein
VPIDVSEPESPGWWLQRLYGRLADPKRQRRLEELDDWYRGVPVLPGLSKLQREAVSTFHPWSRTNFAKLIVEALRERMTPVGIRTSADSDVTGDEEAWRIWQRAGLPVESAEVHRTMFRFGSSYVIVGPPDPITKVPVITAEDPRQIITEHDPAQQRVVVAALKIYHDDIESADFCYLWLPGKLWVARRDVPRQASRGPEVTFAANLFDWDTARGQSMPDSHMLPVHRFRNEDGVAEFEPHLDLLRRINHEVLQRMTIAAFQAFKQRAAINLPQLDEDGAEIDYSEILVSDPGAFWQLPADVEFWESASIDLTPVLSAVKSDIENLASVTRTPMHYLTPAGVNQSAEGAALAKEGLIFKVEDRMARTEAQWSDVISDAFLWLGDAKRADLDFISIIWKPAERESLTARLTAAAQAVTAGVPWKTIMTDVIGFSPQRVDQMQAERADDQLLQAQLLAQTTAITAPAQADAAGQTAAATGTGTSGNPSGKNAAGQTVGQAATNAQKKGSSVPVGNMPASMQANAGRAASGQKLIGQKT